jgi:hypothetical protein
MSCQELVELATDYPEDAPAPVERGAFPAERTGGAAADHSGSQGRTNPTLTQATKTVR